MRTIELDKFFDYADLFNVDWAITNGLPDSVLIDVDKCRVTNDNGFGLIMIVDRVNKKMVQIDSYNLDYYLN